MGTSFRAWTVSGHVALVVACALVASSAEASHARVALRWAEVPGAASYELQIARDKAFSDVVVKETVPTAGYRWENVPTTPHWWRVRSLDKDGRAGPWSEAKEISPKVAAPVLLGPADGFRLPCVPSCSLAVSFEPQQVLESYVVEVSTTADFAHATRFTGTSSPVHAELSGPGTWYFRLLAIDVAHRETEPTEARQAIAFPPPPVPVSPASNAVLPFVEGAPTRLTWSAPDAYARFEVEWHKGKEPAKHAEFAARVANVPLDSAGAWSWRVRAIPGGDQRTDWSNWTNFILAPGAPALASPEDGSHLGSRAPRKELTVRWTGAAAGFAVQTSATADFATPEEHPARCCEAKVTRAPGTTFWRVIPLDEHGNRGAPSEPRSFTIDALPPLAAPRLVTPADGDSVEPGAVSFEWTAVPEAAGYELSASRVNGADSAQRPMSWHPGPALKATETIDEPGAWIVRVRASDSEGIAGDWSEARKFFVGPAPSVRVERIGEWPKLAAGQEADVGFALVDARGRRVPNAPVQVRFGESAPSATSAADGSYRVHLRAPDSIKEPRDEVVSITDRGLSARESIRVEPREGPVQLSAQLGVANNFGAATAPYFGADGVYRLPVLDGRLGVGARAGTWGGTTRIAPSAGDGFSADVAYRVTPVTITLSYLHKLADFDLRGGVGAGMSAFWVDSPDEANGGITGLAQVFAGAGKKLGPGVLAVDASIGFGRGDQSFARLRTGAAVVVLSYGVAP